jgi:ribose transport system permease protein
MLAVVAFAMTAVMAMGDFDLSVGAMASLSGIVAATFFALGYPISIGIGAALLTGLAGGLLNGLLVSWLGILPFVATLGTLTIFSGTAFMVSNGRTIFGRDIPEAFGQFARDGLPLGSVTIPNLSLVALATLLLVWFTLEQTSYGRRLYAIGGNREAARLAGVPVRRLRASAFCITGLGAAVAGLMYASRVASANPDPG